MFITIDPYANAFNETENFAGHQDDLTEMNGWIWERKYEIDSLCYPIQLAYLLYKTPGAPITLIKTLLKGSKSPNRLSDRTRSRAVTISI